MKTKPPYTLGDMHKIIFSSCAIFILDKFPFFSSAECQLPDK
ncbi:hypothetical protein B4099_3122 [Heyndrickxia coagulans]|uniref:Uncharacterized protein n=1 Tax=Heyndrickxia coagulans TaxID=1398 RepID=A0A150KFR4_HEYCO|nr:hypothetical protein B4099_3122 [Heyndrickxia coagulans]